MDPRIVQAVEHEFGPPKNCVREVLYSEEQTQAKVTKLAKQIDQEFPPGEMLVLAALKGAVTFLHDLIGKLDGARYLSPEYIPVSSYVGDRSTGTVEIRWMPNVTGLQVLFVEDILDTLRTSHTTFDKLKAQNPRFIAGCSLLVKPDRHEDQFRAVLNDFPFIGFRIPDEFVVGYGLDYEQMFRTLPYIGILKEEVASFVTERKQSLARTHR